MMTVAKEHDYVSIGVLAADLQRTPRAIEKASEVLAIQPALRLNRVLHFDGEQVEKLTAHFRGQQQ